MRYKAAQAQSGEGGGMFEFGQYLKRLRESKIIKANVLSEMVGISQGHLSNVESGQRGIPHPDILRKLAKALDVSYVGLLVVAGYLTEEELIAERTKRGIADA